MYSTQLVWSKRGIASLRTGYMVAFGTGQQCMYYPSANAPFSEVNEVDFRHSALHCSQAIYFKGGPKVCPW